MKVFIDYKISFLYIFISLICLKIKDSKARFEIVVLYEVVAKKYRLWISLFLYSVVFLIEVPLSREVMFSRKWLTKYSIWLYSVATRIY